MSENSHHCQEMLGYRVDSQVSLWLVAVLEYIAADILKLAGNYVKNIGHTVISCQDIKVAMCADKVLMEMFHQDEEEVSVSSLMEEEFDEKMAQKGTFDVLVKDLIAEEVKFIRDLGLIIKVFRKRFLDGPRLFSENDVRTIFGNIMDLYQLTVSFRGLLEDALEMMDEDSECPAIGECFEDMAEVFLASTNFYES
ncbi:putative son of sevenless-like 1-like [Apostichopus japonicus]|uniref:Putative son of sevenless-like 1-like n=1 Tax=Stichopus japonicus TaxID=307972 RepID=A0A2G8LMS9_STIJA|nr:putative son of sevenless-like 1-like [Apostichopus japonicus]